MTEDKRPKKEFVPPPWEREQFEQLARKRAEKEEAARVAREALAKTEAARQDSLFAQPGAVEQTVLKADAERAITPAAEAPADVAGPGGAIEDETDEMLWELKAEEPKVLRGAWKLGIGIGAVIGFLGMTLTLWGMIASARFARSGPGALLGAGIIAVMGLVFLALAAWMVVRSLRQRGE